MTLAYLAHRLRPARSSWFTPSRRPCRSQATERVQGACARAKAGEARPSSARANSTIRRYRDNPVDRCYFCKTNLYDAHRRLHRRADRLGRQSRRSRRLPSRPPSPRPSATSCIPSSRPESTRPRCVRAIARRLGLADLAELPAQPCLSSRVETGIADRRRRPRLHRPGSSARSRGSSPRGADLRCRVTHGGVVVELGDDAVADGRRRRDRNRCRSCAGRRPRLRRRPPLSPRRRLPEDRRSMSDFEMDWEREQRTGRRRGRLVRRQDGSADRGAVGARHGGGHARPAHDAA